MNASILILFGSSFLGAMVASLIAYRFLFPRRKHYGVIKKNQTPNYITLPGKKSDHIL